MKNTSTTVIEISASTSWARVDSATPNHSTPATSTNTISIQARLGSGVILNSACRVS